MYYYNKNHYNIASGDLKIKHSMANPDPGL